MEEGKSMKKAILTSYTNHHVKRQTKMCQQDRLLTLMKYSSFINFCPALHILSNLHKMHTQHVITSVEKCLPCLEDFQTARQKGFSPTVQQRNTPCVQSCLSCIFSAFLCLIAQKHRSDIYENIAGNSAEATSAYM